MDGGVPRVVYLAVTHWRIVFLVGLVLGAGGGAVVAVADVPTTDRPAEAAPGSVTFERTHSARVVDDATMYDPGSRLDDRALYLQSEAPNLTVREVVRADGPPVDVAVESRLVYHVEYDGSTVYRETGPSVLRAGTIDDGNLTAALAMNTSQVRQRLKDLGSTYGPDVDVQATIATRVEYGDSGAFTLESPIEFTARGYSIESPSERARYGSTGTDRVPDPSRTVAVGGTVVGYRHALGAGLALLGLGVMAVSLGSLRRISGVRRRRLRWRMLRRRFDQLVADVEAGDPPAVDREMASLEDLTFVGQDAGAPVIHFEAEDTYVVRTDDVVYGFSFGDAVGESDVSLGDAVDEPRTPTDAPDVSGVGRAARQSESAFELSTDTDVAEEDD